jgi:hypothetical protein
MHTPCSRLRCNTDRAIDTRSRIRTGLQLGRCTAEKGKGGRGKEVNVSEWKRVRTTLACRQGKTAYVADQHARQDTKPKPHDDDDDNNENAEES